MFFNNHEVSTRKFIRVISLSVLSGFSCWGNNSQLYISRTSSGLRIIAIIPPGSLWELQKSTDGGKTWTALTDKPLPIGPGRIVWNVPSNESAIFRIRLVTEATLKVADGVYQVQADGNLLTAMERLELDNPSFRFTWEWRKLGRFATSINGTDHPKWVFTVDGKRQDQYGISDYILTPGKTVAWLIAL